MRRPARRGATRHSCSTLAARHPGCSRFPTRTAGGSGAGVEHALTRQWSIAAEYKYVDLGTATVGFAGLPASIAAVSTEMINQRYQLLTLGMNYKLN
jgi:opacity protein-like surface antigen